MKTPIPILLYHSIDTKSAPAFQRWVVSPRQFDEQMNYLWQQQYTPLTVSQFIHYCTSSHVALPSKPVVITFDDGFADFYENALPILSKYAFPSTIYITTGFVNKTSQWLSSEGEGNRQMMNWQQIRELPQHGVECGAHTQTHPQLDILSKQKAQEEIYQSKHALQQALGRPINSFAYPHGFYSAQLRHMVQDMGFSSACAVKHALSTTRDDLFALSRIIVSASTTLPMFAQLVEGYRLRVAPQRERWRTKAWRWQRKLKFIVSH